MTRRPTKYAEKTTVSSSKSRQEIEDTIVRYGATKFAFAMEDDRATIIFELKDRKVRFVLPLPNRTDREFLYTPVQRQHRGIEAQKTAYEQAVRQKWRALFLAIKAKLEAVNAGISEFEEEFLAHIVMPNGMTVGELARPQIAESYQTGQMPNNRLLTTGEVSE